MKRQPHRGLCDLMEYPSEKNGPDGAIALGRQMTVEFYDCSSAVLADAGQLEKVFLAAAGRAGATVVNSTFHSFEPQGVSGVVVISESHFAVHAWPEHDYAAVDLFTCGGHVDFDTAVREIATGLRAGQYLVSSLMHRGIVGEWGIERLVPITENHDSRGLQLSWKDRFARTHARAMSAAIDLYGCAVPGLESESFLRNFAERTVRMLEPEQEEDDLPAQWGCAPAPEGVEFARGFRRGHLNGLVCIPEGTMYLDIFTNGFFDPRSVAENAMRELKGRYYRMQPHVRQ